MCWWNAEWLKSGAEKWREWWKKSKIQQEKWLQWTLLSVLNTRFQIFACYNVALLRGWRTDQERTTNWLHHILVTMPTLTENTLCRYRRTAFVYTCIKQASLTHFVWSEVRGKETDDICTNSAVVWALCSVRCKIGSAVWFIRINRDIIKRLKGHVTWFRTDLWLLTWDKPQLLLLALL